MTSRDNFLGFTFLLGVKAQHKDASLFRSRNAFNKGLNVIATFPENGIPMTFLLCVKTQPKDILLSYARGASNKILHKSATSQRIGFLGLSVSFVGLSPNHLSHMRGDFSIKDQRNLWR